MNMPVKDGKEVLTDIKTDDRLKHIPVIMLTSSCADNDVMECYQLHANGYLLKPQDINEHKILLQAVEQFWFKLAILPKT